MGLHRAHLFQFRNPDAALVCRFTQPCFSLAQKIDGTKERVIHFRLRIIAQYMVKTKFDDALKILVAREKMAELSVANMQCVNLFVLLFLKLFIFH